MATLEASTAFVGESGLQMVPSKRVYGWVPGWGTDIFVAASGVVRGASLEVSGDSELQYTAVVVKNAAIVLEGQSTFSATAVRPLAVSLSMQGIAFGDFTAEIVPGVFVSMQGEATISFNASLAIGSASVSFEGGSSFTAHAERFGTLQPSKALVLVPMGSSNTFSFVA